MVHLEVILLPPCWVKREQFPGHMRPLLVTIMESQHLPVHISPWDFPFLPSHCRSADGVRYPLAVCGRILSLKSWNVVLMSCQSTENVGCWFSTWPRQNRCRTNQKANWMFLSLSLIEEFKFSEISHSQALSGGVCWGTLYSLPYETSFDWTLPVSIAEDSTVCLCHLLPGP